MILTKPKSISAGPSDGTGEGVAHSKRWYVALVRLLSSHDAYEPEQHTSVLSLSFFQ